MSSDTCLQKREAAFSPERSMVPMALSIVLGQPVKAQIERQKGGEGNENRTWAQPVDTCGYSLAVKII